MNHYKAMRLLKREGYSAAEVNEFIPFEKDIMIALINQEYQKQKQDQTNG